ncbi:UBA domain-containing protein [Durusdinium trenchii]|uniref:UBA domain-containing protein n=1 Tax=Durusdinium trenchii TaxID=1381693 RepID=A0ABP0KDA7_9DINO
MKKRLLEVKLGQRLRRPWFPMSLSRLCQALTSSRLWQMCTTPATSTPGTKASKDSGTKRMVKLSAEEKERIAAMSSPADMDYEERKRQYAALRRAVYRSASPGLMAKYTLSSDADRFSMMKNFLVNSGVDSIEVEEQYTKYAEESRKDRYITITLFQLEKKFGKGKEAQKFIADLVKGQKGTPHPQSDHPKARMFKVLKDVLEEKVAALERHIAQLEHHLVCAETMSNTPLSDVDVEHMRTEMDTEKFWVTNLN